MDKDFYLKRWKNLLWLREEREKAWGWTEEGGNLKRERSEIRISIGKFELRGLWSDETRV